MAQVNTVVDKIASGIRAELIKLAPLTPSESEYQSICSNEALKHGSEVVYSGNDIDGHPFIKIQTIKDADGLKRAGG